MSDLAHNGIIWVILLLFGFEHDVTILSFVGLNLHERVLLLCVSATYCCQYDTVYMQWFLFTLLQLYVLSTTLFDRISIWNCNMFAHLHIDWGGMR